MKRQGLAKAFFRLDAAKSALKSAKSSEINNDFDRSWSEFLSSLDAIYNCLGQSIGGNEKSRKWYSKLVSLRKEDELLCYLWHARNSDFHGLEAPAHFEGPQLRIGGAADVGFSRHMTINFSHDGEKQSISAIPNDGKPIFVEKSKPKMKLLSVLDRGIVYNPPDSHLGNSLKGLSLIEIGELALIFFTEKMNEAHELSS
jgi:hypothetical protein